MILRILKDNKKKDRKILREVSKEIDLNHPDLKRIVRDLKDTLESKESGVGLAAPQVGIPYRIFIVDYHGINVYINPEIYNEEGEKCSSMEGCLSVPFYRGWGKVSRYPTIGIKYYDENLQLKRRKIRGFKSRIILHEYDHLNGILYTDRIGESFVKTYENYLLEI